MAQDLVTLDRKKLLRMIHTHAQAQIRKSWKGGADPETMEEIEQEASAAWTRLHAFINAGRIPPLPSPASRPSTVSPTHR